MIETFVALLFAHALADFVLQTSWIAYGKEKRELAPFALHTLAVYATACLTLGVLWHPAILLLTLAHLAIDFGKSFLTPGRLWSFLADQLAHLATIVLIAFYAADMWQMGVWAPLEWLPGWYVLASGAVLVVMAGSFAISNLLRPFIPAVPDALAGGGALIGMLERGLVFVMVIGEIPEAVGFLIAAKSLIQMDIRMKELAVRQYIIIGTLASFAWAMVLSWATLALLAPLSPIGIPALSP